MATIECPLCNAATSLTPVHIESDKAVLTDKSTDSYTVYGKAIVSAITDWDHHNACYLIVACQACGERFVVKGTKYGTPDWLPVYPIAHKAVAKEIPEPIRSQFVEACLCFAVEAYTGCLLVCRTALIAIQREKSVTSLKELKEKDLITGFLFRQADEVRLWANMVGHEDVPRVVSKDDCEQLLAYIEALLNALYVEPARLAKLTQKRKETKDTQK